MPSKVEKNASVKSQEAKTKGGCCGCCRRKKDKDKTGTPTPISQNAPLPKPGTASPRVSAATSASLDLAANKMQLSKREREQVTKALEEEMARRRRWRTLLRRGAAQVAAGPPSKGMALFPLPMEETLGGGGPLTPAEEAFCMEPMSQFEKSVNLDDQRKEWLKRMQGQTSPSKKDQAKTKADFGAQPQSLTVDDETAREIANHTLMKMLQKILVQSAVQQALEKKAPGEMTPDELIAFRRRNPTAWDEFTNSNSVASFGLAKPTPEDEQRAKKTLAKNRDKQGNSLSQGRNRPRVHFDPEIDVAQVRVGQDFQPNERVSMSVANLKK